MLWQNTNANLPGCQAYRKGENDRSLITSDNKNPIAQPGTSCQIEFRLIQLKTPPVPAQNEPPTQSLTVSLQA
jgi:hypothetical protein